MQRFFPSFWIQKFRQFFELVPFSIVVKSASLVMLAPALLLFSYLFFGAIALDDAIYGAALVFVLAIIFVYPYVNNLAQLTKYVNELTQGRNPKQPDLSFLNNVEKLSEAVGSLHQSWEDRKLRLENTISENEILIDSIPDILLMLNGAGEVVRTNRKARESFGGTQFDAILHAILSHAPLSAAIEQVQKTGVGQDVKFELKVPFHRHYVIRVERFPSYSPGGISIILALHDVTQQKFTERMLSDFVANASHEMRTPLTSLMGFIETLQTSAKNDKKARAEFLTIMQSQAERMAKLVQDLLSLSQIERNLSTKPTGRIDIAAIVEASVEQQKPKAKEKKIKIEVLDSGKIPETRGDASEILLVIDNLLSNAIKYSEAKTTVEVSLKKVANQFKDPRLAQWPECIQMDVKDQGIGIDPKHIARLTERFYRVEDPRMRKVSGTGLGLSIVKQILDRHDGLLLIESTSGKGSCFTVILPIC